MQTSQLILTLASKAKPVRRLRHPIVRASYWILLAVATVGALCMIQGVRQNLTTILHDRMIAICFGASLLTGVLAGTAAFLVSIPDRSRLWAILPVPTLILWGSDIGHQCVHHWVPVGPGAFTQHAVIACQITLIATTVPLSLVLWSMLRYASAYRPKYVLVLGSLAVGSIAATSVSTINVLDPSAMLLSWNVGLPAIFTLLGLFLGRKAIARE